MNQSKYKWMLFIMLILLISNVVMAFFLFGDALKNPSTKGKEDMAMKIYREIGLDSAQVKVFISSRDDYFEQMRPVWGDIRKLKDSLYHHMEINSSDTVVNALLDKITERNRFADSFTYNHFSKLRTLCTPDQQVRFDTIIPKMINRSRRR